MKTKLSATRKATAAVLAVVTVSAMMSGCASSKASSTTCDQYAAQGFGDQTTTVENMIKEHGFDPTSSIMGTAQISNDVDQYCGVWYGSNKATQNNSNKIENAIDWSTVGQK